MSGTAAGASCEMCMLGMIVLLEVAYPIARVYSREITLR
ncbi:hypothetical protein OIU77_000448 [Salix suchowensis]|uniref:Uncharacterized protein n=1 Tax=Salix suchowensis TaxID=1278906 RepID=A0ABQ9B909_9ROSI|nr:hypothetical protein OIU77_000448 [Salix suchowensis]